MHRQEECMAATICDNVSWEKITAIKFSSATAKKRKLADPNSEQQIRKRQDCWTDTKEWATFWKTLKRQKPSALSVTKGYSQDLSPWKWSTRQLSSPTWHWLQPPSNKQQSVKCSQRNSTRRKRYSTYCEDYNNCKYFFNVATLGIHARRAPERTVSIASPTIRYGSGNWSVSTSQLESL